MTTRAITALLGLMVLPLVAAAETWTDVPVIDTLCVSKVKADPDKHTTTCALQCAKGGYGLLTADGAYLTFDKAGNEKALAALKATKKPDGLRATVEGKRAGETIAVTSVVVK